MEEKFMLGCSGAALSKVESMEEVLDSLKRAGFECVDFWLYRHSLEPKDPMLQGNWRDWVCETKRKIRNAGLIVGQVHGILNTYIPEDFHFEEPQIAAYRNLEAARMMECDRIVFHPAFYVHRVADEDTRRRVLDYNVRWFGKLLDTARTYQVRIQLENTFDFARVQKPEDPPYPFTIAEDLLTVMRGLGDETVEACLDTGHGNACDQDVPAMIWTLGKRIGTIHLNDNYGNLKPAYPDMHLFPGYGTLRWDNVLRALRETGFSGVLNIEPVGSLLQLPKSVRDIQLKAAADVLRELARLAGFPVE